MLAEMDLASVYSGVLASPRDQPSGGQPLAYGCQEIQSTHLDQRPAYSLWLLLPLPGAGGGLGLGLGRLWGGAGLQLVVLWRGDGLAGCCVGVAGGH